VFLSGVQRLPVVAAATASLRALSRTIEKQALAALAVVINDVRFAAGFLHFVFPHPEVG